VRILIATVAAILILSTAGAAEEDDRSIAETLAELTGPEGYGLREAAAEMQVTWVLVVTRVHGFEQDSDKLIVMPSEYSSWEHCRAAGSFIVSEALERGGRRLYGGASTGLNTDCVPILVETSYVRRLLGP